MVLAAGVGKAHALPTGRRMTTGDTTAPSRTSASTRSIRPCRVRPLDAFRLGGHSSHGYQYFAHSAVGRDLHEYILGLNFGSSLDES